MGTRDDEYDYLFKGNVRFKSIVDILVVFWCLILRQEVNRIEAKVSFGERKCQVVDHEVTFRPSVPSRFM